MLLLLCKTNLTLPEIEALDSCERAAFCIVAQELVDGVEFDWVAEKFKERR